MQNGLESEKVSALDYDFEADKPHHEEVVKTFETIMEKVQSMQESSTRVSINQ